MYSSPLKILIVDDERIARRRIDEALTAIAPSFALDIVGHADNGFAALELIEEEKPDVVLLDIQMPGMSGIDLAHNLQSSAIKPAIILLSAYEQYAIDAFDIEAVDYLVKPIKEERLLSALQKVTAQSAGIKAQNVSTHIPAMHKGQLCMIAVEDVKAAKSNWRTIRLYLGDDNEEYTSDWTLQRLEEEYRHIFFRVHRSTLVNMHAVQKIEYSELDALWTVAVKDIENRFVISRRLLPKVRQKLMK